MIRLNNDYNHGACEAILKALQETNTCDYSGYGCDTWCEKAAAAIGNQLGSVEADVHFMVGGTPTNYTVIDAALRPYQSVICTDTGHIAHHEAGSIERTGHQVLTAPAENGKLTAQAIENIMEAYRKSGEPDYLTEPKLVYLSSPSEYGTVYTKTELMEIHQVCQHYGLYLFLDGARLAYWLAAEDCDVTLADLAALTDVFYIGGTKCGALFGEALVIVHPDLRPHFRKLMKQTGGMLAKGWLLGLQFYVLFQENRYISMARHANEQAKRLKEACQQAGIPIYMENHTNQLFVVLSQEQEKQLAQVCIYEPDKEMDANHRCVRLCTSWSTKEEDMDRMVSYILSMKEK